MQQLHRDPRLIYDVGMYDGLDTRYYLDSGYKVLAVEANPELVARAHQHFGKEIRAGQLVVVHAAIGCGAGQTVELITAQDDLGSSSLIQLPTRLTRCPLRLSTCRGLLFPCLLHVRSPSECARCNRIR